MLKKKTNKIFHILCALVLLLGVKTAFAAENFSNNLLKAELHKSPIGGIKIVLFTGKPYNDAVTVNKKSDYEYVLLLPETSNSLTGKPSLKFVSDVVKNIEVRSQPYQSNIKGYTKVVIYTSKPVEISSQVQTLPPVSFKLSESEYKELLAQASKKTEVKSVATKVAPSKTVVPKVIKEKKPTQILKKETTKKIIKQASKKTVLAATKPVLKAKQVVASSKVAAKLPVERKSPVINETKPVSQPKVEVPKTVVPKVVKEVPTKKKIIVTDIKHKIYKIAHLVKSNLYLGIGVILAGFILLLLIAKKMTSARKKSQANFTANLQEQPNVSINYEEKINDNMTWKEKFQTYLDTEAPKVDIEEDSQTSREENLGGLVPTDDELDGLFNPNISIEEVQNDSKGLDEFIDAVNYDVFAPEISVEDLFSESDEFQDEIAPSFNSVKEQDVQIVKSEFVIDEQKALYLVDFENSTSLVGRIDDEYFVLKRFDKQINSPIKARVNEKSSSGVSYMTKVGDFRGVVEVTPHNMNLLIEL